MSWNIVIILVITICLSVNAEFPNDPKPCKYGDGECVRDVINVLLKDNIQGDASINLPSLNPLKFNSTRIQQGEDSPVNLDLLLINSNMHGLETVKAIKVKGFGKDLTKKHSLVFHTDYLSAVGDYEISGKILILPIKGSGKSNISMVDVDIFMNFMGTPVEKDGATYMHIEVLNVDTVPKKMVYNVQNLFNGDKALGDNMNLFLNENWQEIYNEVRGSLNKAYGDVFKGIINAVFSKYPYEKYFTE
ncbi:protein takeout-like [Calliphora vicina]|uniref:protein takeout-like n=1 Tax=Calliphora vicina TaxID=7373 RepID=UPI00325B0671